MKRISLSVLSLFALAAWSPAFANSHTERDAAEAALDRMGPVTDQLTDSTLNNTVKTYGGTNTPEANLESGLGFDDAMNDVITGGGADGQAYQATVDSYSLRPSVDLGSDPLALANDAVENAEAAVGGLFSATSGTCSALFENGSYSGERFCRSILQRNFQSCDLTREISVDREDFWVCEVAERDYTRVCNEDVSWQCTGQTGRSCRTDRITADRPFSWADDRRELRFTLGNHDPETDYVCQIHKQTINLKTYAGYDLTRFRAELYSFRGIAQLRVNGQNLWTYGTPSRGNLKIVYHDNPNDPDGFGIPIPHIYAGQTLIDICPYGSSLRTMPSKVGMMQAFDPPIAGPSLIDASNRPYIDMNEHEDVKIVLLVASYSRSVEQKFRISRRGSCCTSITPVGGEQC